MNNASGIYVILQLSTGRHYVGSAIRLSRRFIRHKSDLRANRHHNAKLQRAWLKHGEADFRFDVLEQCDSEALVEREQYWMDNTRPFYNILRYARSGKGLVMPDSAKETLRTKAKARYAALSDDEKATLAIVHAERIRGKRHSHETRQKMSVAKIGRLSTDEQRASFERNKLNPEAVAKRVAKRARRYIVTTPDGTEIGIQNMCAFARENDLSQAHMVAVAKGKRPAHKGWTCRYDEQ